MLKFEYTIMEGKKKHVFKNLADAWKFADDNGLERCQRATDFTQLHPYLRGPVYWEKNLQFWHRKDQFTMRYSEKAKQYYDNWLQDMFKNERVETKLQTGLQ